MFTTITSEKPNIVSIFLKKKKSSWSLQNFSKNNLFTHTNSTTCSLTHSTICSISSSSHEEDNQTLPPTYDDKSHPWAFQFPKSMLNRIIQPREEEGDEDLPKYECTIERMASAYVKCEFIEPNVRSKKRIWR
ncbi:hypothetical protein G6F56_013728 [Rhizopus delemar]|nr:hypothetical protein G6F56_013728 [Rhizopus delemar]